MSVALFCGTQTHIAATKHMALKAPLTERSRLLSRRLEMASLAKQTHPLTTSGCFDSITCVRKMLLFPLKSGQLAVDAHL